MGQEKTINRDAEATRCAALDAAQHLFAAEGLVRLSGDEELIRLIGWPNLERESTEWPGEQDFTRISAERIRRHLCNTTAKAAAQAVIQVVVF